jgi:hypothetical protein
MKERTATTGRFSCRDCHRQWNAQGEVHCPVCHGHFSGYLSYDLHIRQVGERVSNIDPGTAERPKAGGPVFGGLSTPLGTIWQRA